ncbi:MAG: HD domain-containing phosphohydrolase [bacterium]
MVRMRDVLRSVNDIRRPGQGSESRRDGAQGDEKELEFPSTRSSGFSIPPRQGNNGQRADTEEAVAEVPAVPVQSAAQGKSLYHSTIDAVDSFLDLTGQNKPFTLDDILHHVELFAEALSGSDQLFMQALSARKTITSMAQHSVNVAIVAIKIAYGLKYSRQQAIEVGLCSMVHEVGMVRVPESVLTKRGDLTPSEQELIRNHPEFGYEILQAVVDMFPFLPDVIHQEHERWNGKGYPQGIGTNDIHEYAQVLGLADSFIALTHIRHYRDNFIAYKAMQAIIERRNVDFSARMIKALIDVISIFPVDSLVKLNNGAIAKVIRTNKNYPVRPVIQLLSDSRGLKVDNDQIVDLSNEPMIYIVSPVLDESAYS